MLKLTSLNSELQVEQIKQHAQALLVKVYMHMASSKEFSSPRYEWVTSFQDMYENAVSYAEKVSSSGAYGIRYICLRNFSG